MLKKSYLIGSWIKFSLSNKNSTRPIDVDSSEKWLNYYNEVNQIKIESQLREMSWYLMFDNSSNMIIYCRGSLWKTSTEKYDRRSDNINFSILVNVNFIYTI